MGYFFFKYLGYWFFGWYIFEIFFDSELRGMFCDCQKDWEYIDVSDYRGFEVEWWFQMRSFFLYVQ